jgi:hypothetical protein
MKNTNSAVNKMKKTVTNVTEMPAAKTLAAPKGNVINIAVPSQAGMRLEVGDPRVPFGIRYIR